MFIKIQPGVQVWITKSQKDFLDKYKDMPYFRNTDLQPDEVNTAKILADKSIFVRKKLDTDVQYALNRRIRFVNVKKNKT
jgi:hypothetical protein